MQLPYDDNSETSILNYALKLRDKNLSQILDINEVRSLATSAVKKGELGQLVEFYYFGIKNNNLRLPDFQKTGIELKVTPVIKDSSGKYKAKERLVLGIINYEEEYKKSWLTSTFITKSSKLLIIFYQHQNVKDVMEQYFRLIGIHKFTEPDITIIKYDWETIVRFIKEGRAHEIHEKDTYYLAACRKGAGNDKDLRKQPFSNIMALQRAFSLKTSYMNIIITNWSAKKDMEMDKIIHGDDLRNMNLEEIVIEKISKYYGYNISTLEKITNYQFDPSAKNKYSIIGLRLLGVNKPKAEEFEKAGIKIKTIRLLPNGSPKESISFPYFHYNEIVKEDWESSSLFSNLNKRFLFIIFQYDANNELIFKKAMFWTIPYSDFFGEVKETWETTKFLVGKGQINHLPGIKQTNITHVRPHGRNNKDVDLAPDGKFYPKKCFWLNAGYIKKIIS